MSFQSVGSEETLYVILLAGKTCFEEKNEDIFPNSPAPKPETWHSAFMDFRMVLWHFKLGVFFMFGVPVLRMKNRDKHDCMQGSCVGSAAQCLKNRNRETSNAAKVTQISSSWCCLCQSA